MSNEKKIDKGGRVEEHLRGYFLRAGFFAVRGVPVRRDGEYLTDVDIWLYERPTGSSRRRQVVDAKGKTRPKAIERIYWTKGLMSYLNVDGGYVATTDTRQMIRDIAYGLGLSVLDGADLKRIQESEKVLFKERIFEEDLYEEVKALDKSEKTKRYSELFGDLKNAVIEEFGAGSVNRCLSLLQFFAEESVAREPGSKGAHTLMRLTFLSSAFVAIGLDYVMSWYSFRPLDERRQAMLNAIRYGDSERERGLERIRLATALVERYAPSGKASARAVKEAVEADLESIPAEIIADHVIRNLRSEPLFRVAKDMEYAAYLSPVPGFDDLSAGQKSFLGALLDFAGIDRSAFAKAVPRKSAIQMTAGLSEMGNLHDDGSLFSYKKDN